MPPRSKSQPKAAAKAKSKQRPSSAPTRGRGRPSKYVKPTYSQIGTQTTKVIQDNNGGSMSYYTRNYKKSNFKTQLKGVPANSYFHQGSSRFGSSVGQQAYYAPATMFGGALGGGTNANDVEIIRELIQPSTGNAAKTTKYILRSINEQFAMTNQDNNSCQLYIYDIIVKKNSVNTFQTDQTKALGDQQAVGGVLNTSTPNIFPEFTPALMKNYKIQEKKRIILNPGETHYHKKYLKHDVLVDCGEIGMNNFYNIKGLTQITLFIAIGIPINDTMNKNSEVSTGTTTISLVRTRTIKYSFLSDTTTNTSYSATQLITAFTAGESIMDPAKGSVQTSASA